MHLGHPTFAQGFGEGIRDAWRREEFTMIAMIAELVYFIHISLGKSWMKSLRMLRRYIDIYIYHIYIYTSNGMKPNKQT